MSSVKNTTNLYSLASNTVQQKGLKMQLNKLDLHNRLVLTLNKKIEKFPHNKVSDKLGGSLNQNIVFNFSNKNSNTDRRLIYNKNKNLIISIPSTAGKVIKGENTFKLLRSKITDLGPVQVKNPARLGITNNVLHIITSFFKGLGCLIARPQFIHKTDKLIIRIFYYQNNKDVLFNNNKSNFIYNLFNGTGAAKAQYNAPKSQNFATILRDMLGQTKWNKIVQTIFNNESINTLELASITKKVFILFIKDLIQLTSSNKALSIEKALTQLQKGGSGLDSIFAGAGRISKIPRLSSKRAHNKISIKNYNQLLIKLISSTNSESLIKKRTRLSKIFFNKTLLAKLIKKVNNHNNNINLLPCKTVGSKKHISSKELIGKGLLLNPINKKKLDALLAWSNDRSDLSGDYKTIATALLALIKNNKIPLSQKEKGQNTQEKTVLRLQNILINKINKNLKSLSTQFADEASKIINFAPIIKKTHSTFLTRRFVNTTITKITNSTLFPFRAWVNQGIVLGPKFIKLINKQFGLEHVVLPYIGLGQEQKDSNKMLILIKELFKAYNYGLNNNKKGFTGILSTKDNVNKFKLLGSLLTKIFKKNIDLQIIKMHNVGLQENIIAKIISENAKFDKSSVLIKKLLKKIAISNASLIQFNKQNKILNNNDLIYNSNLHNSISVPVFNRSKLNINEKIGVKLINTICKEKTTISFDQLYDQIKNVNFLHTNPIVLGKVVGLNIRIAGRLQKEQVRPKQTVKTITVGSLSKERSNNVSLGSFVSKNKKGTFRITVKMAHIRTFSSF
jgi:Mitochondrial ribosomal protein (VAR1)